jgi:hypothetical protein
MNPLTEEQKKALRNFKRVHGKSWRTILSNQWMKAHVSGISDHDCHVLYCLRNTNGPTWLANLKLSDFMRPVFKPVPSPFGTAGFKDEQATQDAFVEYVGGWPKAERLSRLWNESYPKNDPWKPISKIEVFRRKARGNGFEDEDVDAFLML